MNTLLLILITTILNNDRINLKPLTPNIPISIVAQKRADDLCAKNQWSHVGFPDYVFNASGVSITGRVGENLATGFNGNLQAMNTGLMNSPTHKANIMSKYYNFVGIGYSTKCDILVQLFAQYVR